MSDQLPLASSAYERSMQEHIGSEWRTMAPDEWVARNIHNYVLWGWADYTFPDPEFNAWLRTVETYLNQQAIREVRERYLTPEQLAEVEEYERGPF